VKLSSDRYGNKTLQIERHDIRGKRGFSIRTLGNLTKTHGMTVDTFDYETAAGELFIYVRAVGTIRQKRLLGITNR